MLNELVICYKLLGVSMWKTQLDSFSSSRYLLSGGESEPIRQFGWNFSSDWQKVPASEIERETHTHTNTCSLVVRTDWRLRLQWRSCRRISFFSQFRYLQPLLFRRPLFVCSAIPLPTFQTLGWPNFDKWIGKMNELMIAASLLSCILSTASNAADGELSTRGGSTRIG